MAAKGARSMTEVGCKKQFDNMDPNTLVRAFMESTQWIYKKRDGASLTHTGPCTKIRQHCIGLQLPPEKNAVICPMTCSPACSNLNCSTTMYSRQSAGCSAGKQASPWVAHCLHKALICAHCGASRKVRTPCQIWGTFTFPMTDACSGRVGPVVQIGSSWSPPTSPWGPIPP